MAKSKTSKSHKAASVSRPKVAKGRSSSSRGVEGPRAVRSPSVAKPKPSSSKTTAKGRIPATVSRKPAREPVTRNATTRPSTRVGPTRKDATKDAKKVARPKTEKPAGKITQKPIASQSNVSRSKTHDNRSNRMALDDAELQARATQILSKIQISKTPKATSKATAEKNESKEIAMADDKRKSQNGTEIGRSEGAQSPAGTMKGANPQRRTALGRGLSVLLSSNAVQVRPERTTAFIETSEELPTPNFSNQSMASTAFTEHTAVSHTSFTSRSTDSTQIEGRTPSVDVRNGSNALRNPEDVPGDVFEKLPEESAAVFPPRPSDLNPPNGSGPKPESLSESDDSALKNTVPAADDERSDNTVDFSKAAAAAKGLDLGIIQRNEPTRALAHAIERSQFASDIPGTDLTIETQPLLGASGIVHDDTMVDANGDDSATLRFVAISDVVPSPTQPRKNFVRDELEALSRSIQESGLLQPLVVRKNPTGEPFYEIVAGERRFRAAKLAGLREIPVIVREVDDREALGLAIIENVQRSDLNPVEEAESYQRLISEFGETQEGVARLIGKDRATIANALRLLRLAPGIRAYLTNGQLSAGHGRALLAIEDPVRQVTVAEQAVREALSVRAVEKLAQEGNPNRKKAKAPSISAPLSRSFSAVEIEDRIRRTLGTKVTLSLHSAETGEVRISFFSKAELENLLERIGA